MWRSRNRQVNHLSRLSLDLAVGVFHTQHRRIRRDVEKAFMKSQAVRAREGAGDNLHFVGLTVLVKVGQDDDVSFRLARDEERAVGADGHQPRVGHVGGEDRDLEPFGYFQFGGRGWGLRRSVLSLNGKAGGANETGGRREKRASGGEANLVHWNFSP